MAIDTSQLRAARIGVRGDNDIVWIGRAANCAAKLTNWGGKQTRITADVFNRLPDQAKFYNGQAMWVPDYWGDGRMNTYSSTWYWPVD